MVIAVRKGRSRERDRDAGPRTVDDDVRSEIIETVRRFVAARGHPGRVGARAHRHLSRPRSWSRCASSGSSASPSPRRTAGLGLDLLTYIGVIEELAYGWMSLTGIVNTHTMAATLIMTHGTEEQKQRLAPRHGTGERRGALSLSEPDAGSDTRNISCRAQRRRRRVHRQRHQGLGHQRGAGQHRRPGRPDRGGHLRLHRREGARPALRGDLGQQARGQARLPRRRDGRDGVRRPPHPRRQPDRRGRARPAPDPRRARGRPHQHRGPGGRRGPGGVRRRARLQPAARDHGQGHRRAPGDPAEAGRHGDAPRGRPPAHPQRRRAPGAGAALRRRGRHGQALRQRDGARAQPPRRCGSTAGSATPPSSRSSATTATRR